MKKKEQSASNIKFLSTEHFYKVAFGPFKDSEETGLKWLVKKYMNKGCNTAINNRRYILRLLALAIPSGADSGTIINLKVRTWNTNQNISF